MFQHLKKIEISKIFKNLHKQNFPKIKKIKILKISKNLHKQNVQKLQKHNFFLNFF